MFSTVGRQKSILNETPSRALSEGGYWAHRIWSMSGRRSICPSAEEASRCLLSRYRSLGLKLVPRQLITCLLGLLLLASVGCIADEGAGDSPVMMYDLDSPEYVVADELFDQARPSFDGLSPLAPQVDGESRLGPADIFQLDVWGNMELSGESVVGPDGAFTLPFYGVIMVGELTRTESGWWCSRECRQDRRVDHSGQRDGHSDQPLRAATAGEPGVEHLVDAQRHRLRP
ncbi:MAG: hypothetical protein ACI9EF_001354 [Pseudohongiellaceae bacterium]